jgi:hypothetical protein
VLVPAVNPTVEVVDERLRELLAEEGTFADSLDKTSSWTAGFAGTILTLTVAVRKFLLDLHKPLDQPWQNRLFVMSIVLLGASIGAALAVLWPRSRWHTSASEAVTWPYLTFLPPDTFRARQFDELLVALGEARSTNGWKNVATRFSLALMAFGVAGVAAQALIGILR